MWEQLFEEQLADAENGDADAQYEVGIMYLKGQGVQPDRAKAVSWLSKASESGNEQAESKLRRIEEQEDKYQRMVKQAETGDVKAQYDIAMMYLKGRGVEQSDKQARYWLTKAAARHDEKAITRLGILNYKGEGGKTDYKKAAKLFSQVSQNSTLAQYYLGEMYAEGSGVEKNHETAIAWYKKAAEGGFDRARGKIINLEEELKMIERRKINLAEKQVQEEQVPEKQLASKKTQQKVVPQIQASKSKTAPVRKKTVLSPLDKLAGKNWVRSNKPVEFLPSEITSCEKEKEGLVCFSEILKRMSGTQSVQYRVKSVITSAQGLVLVSYKNLVIDVEETQEADDAPLGYDDELEKGFSIRTGWTQEHVVECKQAKGKSMDCMKNRTHAMEIVEG